MLANLILFLFASLLLGFLIELITFVLKSAFRKKVYADPLEDEIRVILLDTPRRKR